MGRPLFLSFRREPLHITTKLLQRASIPWIESPIEEREGSPPHLFRHADATPIELFYDLFLVANLSTFTATHEINNLETLWAYVSFLGVLWFTWLQVALFDIRFARDSIFERVCKALQLAAMVGFASAGSRLATRITDENIWAFQALSALLAGSRLMLAIQYIINIGFMYERLRPAVKGMCIIVGVLLASGFTYMGLYFALGHTGPQIWTVWFALFLFEMFVIMGVSSYTPGIGFQHTHLNVRMALLTLIIIGEATVSVTRIVNKVVAGGGWTQRSFAHILGVTTTVYLLWQSYYDISPRVQYGKVHQQIWTQLHFPFHAVLILSAEGCQLLALTLDIALKIRYLGETIAFACEEPRPNPLYAIKLLNSTIADMEIDYSRGALGEKKAIDRMIDALWSDPGFLCPANDSTYYLLTHDRTTDLLGNVTVSLFSSMGITPSTDDLSQFSSRTLLMMYIHLLGFVYVYYFIVTSLAMIHFAVFVFLTRRHPRRLYNGIAIGTRFVFAALLMSLASFIRDFNLTYHFMTSPVIIYTFTLTLFTVLLVDRLLDWLAVREQRNIAAQRSPSGSECSAPSKANTRLSSQHSNHGE